MPIAHSVANLASQPILDPGVAHKGKIGLLHGEIDELPFARAFAVVEGGCQGAKAVEASNGVRVHETGVERLAIAVAKQGGHA